MAIVALVAPEFVRKCRIVKPDEFLHGTSHDHASETGRSGRLGAPPHGSQTGLQSASGFEPGAVTGRDPFDSKCARVFCCHFDALGRRSNEMQNSDHGDNAAIAD